MVLNKSDRFYAVAGNPDGGVFTWPVRDVGLRALAYGSLILALARKTNVGPVVEELSGGRFTVRDGRIYGGFPESEHRLPRFIDVKKRVTKGGCANASR